MDKAILLIMDGLGDLPNSKNQTPLSSAKTPNMDKLAKKGILGMLAPLGKGNVPGSDTSHLTLLGYPYWDYYPGRGPLEALGCGIKLKEGDVAFRANFATVERGRIIDRRAGRIPTSLARKLEDIISKIKIKGVTIIFKATSQHRGVLVLRGKGLGAEVSGTDPHAHIAVPKSRALKKNSANQKTAKILNEFTKKAMALLAKAPENKKRKLPANAVLVRGAGMYRKVEPFAKKHGITGACIAGGALYKGVANYIGMDVLAVPGASGTYDTDLKSKGRHAALALKNHDFVFVHVKGTDNASHDKNFIEKKKMIERVDKELVPLLAKTGANLVITGDHTTSSITGKHTGNDVPFLALGSGFRRDLCSKFSEVSCMSGGLGHLDGWDVFPIILNSMDRGRKVGT